MCMNDVARVVASALNNLHLQGCHADDDDDDVAECPVNDTNTDDHENKYQVHTHFIICN